MLGTLLVVLFGLVAVVGRVALQVRRTGDTGVRLRGLRGWEAVSGPALFVAWFLVIAGARNGADAPGVVVVVGLVLYGIGLSFTVWSQLAMADSWRIGVDPGERTELVTTGPFAYVRHPIFTGMTLAMVGVALVAWHPLAVGGVVLLAAAVEVQARLVEEPYLRRAHPDYVGYERTVPRFLPTRPPLSRSRRAGSRKPGMSATRTVRARVRRGCR